MRTITKKVFSELPNTKVDSFKQVENKRCGISVKTMKAKINGCFQTNFTRLTLIIDETVIGKTCNGGDFFDALKMANVVINENRVYLY